MSGIIEKLGITPGPWGRHVLMVKTEKVEEERLDGESWLDMRNRQKPERDAAHAKEIADLLLANSAPEMLEALIEAIAEELETIDNIGGCDHSVNVCCCHEVKLVEKHIKVVEKATGKSWEEIKELLK